MTMPMATLPARLVQYQPGRRAALPAHTTLELVEYPKPEALPGCAGYGQGLLAWQGRRIPMVDLDALLHPEARADLPAASRYALVVGYQPGPGLPVEHGAIGLQALPELVVLDDPVPCSLPVQDAARWQPIALACFEHEGTAVPVIDTAALFGRFHG